MAAENEYGSVVRINPRTQTLLAAASHELILDSEPLHVRQYCRTMTLAQGRILYQLLDDWEPWHSRHCGYMVPSYIVAEARKISCRHRDEDWKGLDPLRVRRYEETWDAVAKAWPGIPVFGARRVVERLVRSGRSCGKDEVDEAVKRYAMRHWTSYWVRLESRGVADCDTLTYYKTVEEVEEQVAGRLRGVLETWTTPGIALPWDFLERHGLQKATTQSFVPSRKFF